MTDKNRTVPQTTSTSSVILPNKLQKVFMKPELCPSEYLQAINYINRGVLNRIYPWLSNNGKVTYNVQVLTIVFHV